MTRLEFVNLALAILGIFISAGGFAITVLQIKKTRTAVDAAESATRGAISGLSARLTVTELADMRSGLRGIQTALRGQRYETALINTQVLIEQLSALRLRSGFDTQSRHAEIQAIVAQLAKLRNKLEQRIAVPSTALSVPKANNILAEFGGTFSVWAEELRFTIGEEEA